MGVAWPGRSGPKVQVSRTTSHSFIMSSIVDAFLLRLLRLFAAKKLSPPVPSDGTCPLYAGGWINASLSPTRTNRVTMWTRGPTTKTCSRTETPPHAARPEWQKARAHRRDRLGPGSDGACSRPISSRPAYPSCQNAVPQGQDRQRNGKYYRLNSRHPPANIAPCLVRLKNQFSLTRAALSTCGSAKSNFLSVAWGRDDKRG